MGNTKIFVCPLQKDLEVEPTAAASDVSHEPLKYFTFSSFVHLCTLFRYNNYNSKFIVESYNLPNSRTLIGDS